MDLLIMMFFSYKNYKLAESLSESGLKWAFITSTVWLIMQLFGLFIFMSFTMIDLSNIQQIIESPDQAIFLVLLGPACGYLGYILVNRSLHNSGNEEEYFNDENL